AFAFETTGDLTTMGTNRGEVGKPMSPDGEKAFYDAIRGGKGFIGMHCATDTFAHHRKKSADDPYVQMIGAQFVGHGRQQVAKLDVGDPEFPGARAFGPSFKIRDEWYALKIFADNLHVIIVQDTEGMQDNLYKRPPFPETYARMHDKGRVFYTSMGHRE